MLSFFKVVEDKANIKRKKNFGCAAETTSALLSLMPCFCCLLQKSWLRFPQRRLPLSVSTLWNPECQMESEIKSSNNLGWKGPQEVVWSKPSQSGADFVVKCNLEARCSCLGPFPGESPRMEIS